MLLYDPAGQDGWTGTFRVVVQVHADVEEEMAADPLLGEVGWSWLTDALDLHAPGYAAPERHRHPGDHRGVRREVGRSAVHRVRAARVLVPGRRRGRRDLADEIGGAVARLVRAAGVGGRPARPGTVAIGGRPADARAAGAGRGSGSGGRRRR